MDQTCISRTFPTGLENLGGQIELSVVFLKYFLNHFHSVTGHTLWLEAANAIRVYCLGFRLYLVSYNVQVGGMCQSTVLAGVQWYLDHGYSTKMTAEFQLN